MVKPPSFTMDSRWPRVKLPASRQLLQEAVLLNSCGKACAAVGFARHGAGHASAAHHAAVRLAADLGRHFENHLHMLTATQWLLAAEQDTRPADVFHRALHPQ